MREHTELTSELSSLVKESVSKKIKGMKKINVSLLKKEITKLLSDIIYEKTERSPMIMPVVMIVE
ncbi:MAG: Ribonuclease J 1 [Candidatus Izimaplasma bacterium HR2]|nr:MAG: Ribonuclease J 1 [Candidatus Izimaplasma bacterium HR2]